MGWVCRYVTRCLLCVLKGHPSMLGDTYLTVQVNQLLHQFVLQPVKSQSWSRCGLATLNWVGCPGEERFPSVQEGSQCTSPFEQRAHLTSAQTRIAEEPVIEGICTDFMQNTEHFIEEGKKWTSGLYSCTLKMWTIWNLTACYSDLNKSFSTSVWQMYGSGQRCFFC